MLGVRCDVDIFKLTVGAQSIYREVYGSAQGFVMNEMIKLKQILIYNRYTNIEIDKDKKNIKSEVTNLPKTR